MTIPIIDIILLIIGLAILVKSADIFVGGASNIAYNYRIPTVIVGLTIVAFGTSAPEAAMSLTKTYSHQFADAIGTVVGSNIFNILGVIGVSALYGTLTVDKDVIKRDLPFLIISTVGLLIITLTLDRISRPLGAIFLIIIFAYVFYLVKKAKEDREEMSKEIKVELPIKKAVLYTTIGLIGIIIGSFLTDMSTSNITNICHLSGGIIGFTIIALGTSLPELVTSISALKKGETGMVIGNVLGSNIFNILFTLGICSAIFTMGIPEKVIYDIVIMTAVTLVGALFIYTKNEVDKKEGIALVLLYLVYLAFTFYTKTGGM